MSKTNEVLSEKQKELIKYIEDNWEGAKFVDTEHYDDDIMLIFDIPDKEDDIEFSDFANMSKIDICDSIEERVRTLFGLTED